MLSRGITATVVTVWMSFTWIAGATAAPGDHDPDFGDGGIVRGVSGVEVVVHDGRIVIGETHFGYPRPSWMEAVRLLPDGTLDPAFGDEGRAAARFVYLAVVSDVVVQAGGKVVLAGTRDDPSGSVIAAARFLTNGALDDTFSGDGKVTTSFPGHAEANAVALQPDGKIVVAGTDGPHFVLVRYLRTGALDPTFGAGGRVTTVLPRDSWEASIEDLAIDAEGRIVAVGTLNQNVIVVARYNEHGVLNYTSFGQGDGLRFTGGTGRWYGNAVALQPDGKIVVGGLKEEWNHDTEELDTFGVLTRYTNSGRPDPTFGVRLIAHPGVEWYGVQDLGLQPDGKIVAIGPWSLLRLMPDGRPDLSFGAGDGIATPTSAQGLAIQPDGRIVVVGASGDLARFLP